MVDWAKKVRENGVGELPRDIQKVLNKIEGMPGDPAKSMMRRKGFENLKDNKYDRGRQVWGHEDTPGLVYKVAVDSGNWQNEIEAQVWFDNTHPSFSESIPEEVYDYLCPILDSDINTGNHVWLIMPRAELGNVKLSEHNEFIEDMLETGWVVTDFHYGNIGHLNGDLVFVDYGQLKPKRFLRDNWREAMNTNGFIEE